MYSMRVVAALLLAAGVARADDASFQRVATAYAKRTTRQVGAWGTARLDGARAVRFATLTRTDKKIDRDERATCAGHVCRGAYLIEAADDKLFVVTFDDDRLPTTAFHRDDDATPSWRVLDDPAIRHIQVHIGGTTDLRFALHAGTVVVVRIYDEQRRNDWVDDRTFDCAKSCPPLAGFDYKFDYTRLRVGGPDRPDQLAEPSVPD
jgi:hypothetical protein